MAAAVVIGDEEEDLLRLFCLLGEALRRRGSGGDEEPGARDGLNRRGDAVRRVPENGHGGDAFTPVGVVVGRPVRVGEDVAWPQLIGECAGGSGRCQVALDGAVHGRTDAASINGRRGGGEAGGEVGEGDGVR